ncbi:MAG: helix-turn-helix domain-containing protein [Desulfobulbaceae bacterium]|nr:helix-turn-helix domain-containing protein [Desulfobulbaceae bacterium]
MKFIYDDVWQRICTVTNWTKQIELANYLGIDSSSVSGAKSRKIFPIEWAFKVAQGFDTSTDYLLTGKGGRHSGESKKEIPSSSPTQKKVGTEQTQTYRVPQLSNPEPELFAYVPLVSARLSAGGGAFVYSDDIIGYYAFRKDWLKRTTSGIKNVVLSIVTGNSMFPTLRQKDFVMVDTGQIHIIDDLIYAIRVDETVMVKRLHLRSGGKIKVISDNHEYESYETTHADLHIIGQVVWSCRSYLTGV